MTEFQLTSNYSPSGDQPKAIDALVSNLDSDVKDRAIHCDRELLNIDGKWIVQGIENE